MLSVAVKLIGKPGPTCGGLLQWLRLIQLKLASINATSLLLSFREPTCGNLVPRGCRPSSGRLRNFGRGGAWAVRALAGCRNGWRSWNLLRVAGGAVELGGRSRVAWSRGPMRRDVARLGAWGRVAGVGGRARLRRRASFELAGLADDGAAQPRRRADRRRAGRRCPAGRAAPGVAGCATGTGPGFVGPDRAGAACAMHTEK